MTAPTNPIELQFGAAMAEYGLNPDEIIADGKRRRFDADDDKRGKKSAWYVLYGDGVPAGAFGNWKTGLAEKWCGKSDTALTPIERDAYRQRIEQARADAEKERQHLQAEAAAECVRIMETALDATDDNPYCVRKGIKPYGLKEFKDKRTLIVPIRDASGALTSLQFIDAEGVKRFKSNGRIQSCYYSFGGKPVDTVLLCEGFATGASLHQVTGYPVAVAFNAGNLEAVAKVLRAKLPDIRIIVCADNDRFNEAGNVGVDHAMAAALAVDGLIAIPVFMSDAGQPTDFNDLHQIEGGSAVMEMIEDAHLVEVPAAAAVTEQVASLHLAPAKPAKKKRDKNGVASGFTVTDLGVFYADDDGNPHWICSRLDVLALVRDSASENWGRLLAWQDADKVDHRWSMPMEMLKSDGADMRGELARLGLDIAPSLKARNKLSEYVISAKPHARARCVVRTGWHGGVFVLPDRTIGASKELVIYQSEMSVSEYATKGSLVDWRKNVAAWCAGNPRLLLAISTALAGMLLHHAGEESGGLHYVGNSSTGKTTALRAACSVYGGPGYLHRWRATANGLEGLAAQHNDTLLVLDELAQCEPREAGTIAYMLANGSGKARAGRTGKAKPSQSWHLLFLSAGEIGLAQHMNEGGKKVKAGQEVRLVEIQADAGKGYGLFDVLHGHEDGAALSRTITEAASQYYGTPAIAFLEALSKDLTTLPKWIKSNVADFVAANLPADASGQANRVCNRFALIGLAGEYATANGITGWTPGEALEAAAVCFASWMENRGGAGNQERTAILSSVKAFFESHGESRFADLSDMTNRITVNRAGFRSSTTEGQEYFVLTEAYKRDVCAGFDMRTVTKVLTDAGWLAPDSAGKGAQRKRLPEMGLTRCYVFTPKMWEA